MIWGYPHFRLGHLHMGIVGWFMVGNPSIWVNYYISLAWIVRPWMGMISLIVNGWELGTPPYDLGNPHKYHKSPKVVGRCETLHGEHFDAKKSEPHPQKSMFKEICPQSWGNDRNWMLKHLKQLTLGDENQKKYTNSTDSSPCSYHFPTIFACWYLVVGTPRPAFWAHTHLLQKSSSSPAVLKVAMTGKYDLVGGAITILKNMSSSMGRMTSHIWNEK